MTKEEIAALKAADAAEKTAYTKLAVMAVVMHGMCMAGAHEDLLAIRDDNERGHEEDSELADNLGYTCEMIADQLLIRSGLMPDGGGDGKAGGAA